MSPTKALEAMSTEDLEALRHDLRQEHAGLRERQRAVAAVLDSRYAAEEAQRKVAAMNDTERAALAQALTAEGIASAEAMGEPGR